MKEHATRRSRTTWRIGASALLLTLTLGTTTTAQTPLRWRTPANPESAARAAGSEHDIARQQHRDLYVRRNLQPLGGEFDVHQFESMAQQLVAGQRVPGLAMAIVHKGRVLSARGYGITDTRAAESIDSHTVFRLASLSKSFAGTMTGLLVNDGSLRWDSKVSQYLPDFRLRDPDAAQRLTVADLLSHRVGLTHNAYDRELEAYVDYRTLTHKLANAPLKCQPGTCYSYQNIAFSLIGDVVFAATGDFYSQEVQRRILKPLGMNDASLGLEGIQSSARWAKPHVRGRGGWVSVRPKTTYYQVAPAAGVNASISDMAQYLLAHTGHRPDVLPAPLLATLHQPLVSTPTEIRGSSWRRTRLNAASYALGWRVYDYSGEQVVFHAGAVQGYRGMLALLPDHDLGIAILWNSESSLPTGLLPTILDRAIGLPTQRWLDVDEEPATLYVEGGTAETQGDPGSNASRAAASPH